MHQNYDISHLIYYSDLKIFIRRHDFRWSNCRSLRVTHHVTIDSVFQWTLALFAHLSEAHLLLRQINSAIHSIWEAERAVTWHFRPDSILCCLIYILFHYMHNHYGWFWRIYEECKCFCHLFIFWLMHFFISNLEHLLLRMW